jgi:large subunit ribosomal protein L35
MPKAKTNKSVRKRVRVTKSGKIKFRHSFTSHLMSSRCSNRRRKLRRRGVAAEADTKRMLALLGSVRP